VCESVARAPPRREPTRELSKTIVETNDALNRPRPKSSEKRTIPKRSIWSGDLD